MASAPVLLLFVWFFGAHLYGTDRSLNNDFEVMEGSLLSLFLLLFALDILAFPTTPIHRWRHEDMAGLKFRAARCTSCSGQMQTSA
eukprot:CAMPEP_0175247504 /NCGR_PEP_ID=MMETSP0093-20121207/33655_1 /TAXON_ID=311494 /ORGANISM="Alexandrium monilatum, Strain CCMP3105" /LENGTH=85 /DNA_ID=CAMNT_0016541687 /DNA_START=135 /DNA_END=392 /DNA_ORIENTATION=+